jgi:hypothetical protein
MAFIVTKNLADVSASLKSYINQEAVRTSKFDRKLRQYTYMKNGLLHKSKGLTNYLRKTFYSHFKISKRRHTKETQGRNLKKSSSKRLGKLVDRQIGNLISGRKLRKGTQWHPLTLAIARHWEATGVKPVASQLPVQIPSLGIMTQADVIVQDNQGNLYMHEIKTGSVALNIVKGTFQPPFQKIPCTKAAQWDLQRHFTDMALRQQGLEITSSKVIHAYEKKEHQKSKKTIPIVEEKQKLFKK